VKITDHLQKNNYNPLIMGSSRTYEGIHPFLLDSKKLNPFKWGFAGFGPKYNYYFYKLYKKIKGKPKVVIFGIDYFIYTLFSSPSALAELNTGTDSGFILNYLDPSILLLKNKKNIDIVIKDIISSFSPGENAPIRNIDEIQAYTGSKKSTLKNYKVYTERKGPYKGSAFTKPPGIEGEYFFKMLDELREDNVKLILVVIPEYIGTFRTNKFQRIFRMHLKRLKKKYENIRVLNYNYIKKFNLGDDSLFLDGGYGYTNSHLSKKGAEIFNKMLKRDIENIKY
ncbi:MAG: hypothetical protein KAS97_07680, partial [Candidatus Aminicenantes bacterium]|nr:hypothetical protein [Candidatus Aminicenantes bacterium]